MDAIGISYSRSGLEVLKSHGIDTSAGVAINAEGSGIEGGGNKKGDLTLSADMSKRNITVSPYYSHFHNSEKTAGSDLAEYGVTVYSKYKLSGKWNLKVAWLDHETTTKDGEDDDSSTVATTTFSYSTKWSPSVTFGFDVGVDLMAEHDGRLFVPDIQDKIEYTASIDLMVF